MIRNGILAFDRGVRPERRCAGLTLLERGIRTMARAGIERLVVVVPIGAGTRLGKVTRRLDLQLEIVPWGAGQDLPFPPGEAVLVLLGDCVHHHTSLSRLAGRGMQGADFVVQTSSLPPRQDPSLHLAAAPGTARFHPLTGEDAGAQVVTGAFLCSAAIGAGDLAAAASGRADDGDSLTVTDFLAGRYAGRNVETAPVAGAEPLWRRVADRRSSRQAKGMLFSQVTKATSGPVSRHLNARLSIPVSKLLIETGISPHLVTVLFVMPPGLAGAWLISRPDEYLWFALAGVLWQLAAVLDRCDGEIARVQLSESKFGAWFDTLTDNFAYLCAYVGFLFGIQRVYGDKPLYLYLALSAVGALLVILGVMYTYALKTGSGSLQKYLVGFSREVPVSEKGYLYRLLEPSAFIAKRDSFSFVFLVCCLADAFAPLYWYTVGGLHLLALGVLISLRKMLSAHRLQARGAPGYGEPRP